MRVVAQVFTVARRQASATATMLEYKRTAVKTSLGALYGKDQLNELRQL
jgi:hypothetical protein